MAVYRDVHRFDGRFRAYNGGRGQLAHKPWWPAFEMVTCCVAKGNGYVEKPGISDMGKLQSRLYQTPAQKSPVRHAFLDLGEDERVARVMAAVVDVEDATPANIAAYTGYTLGTALNTLGELDDRGWLSSREVASLKRGRNPTAYTLKVSKTAMQRHYMARMKEHLAVVVALL